MVEFRKYWEYLYSLGTKVVWGGLALFTPIACHRERPVSQQPFSQDTTALNHLTMQEAFRRHRIASINDYLYQLPKGSEQIDTVTINRHNFYTRKCLGAYSELKDSVCMKYFIADTAGLSPKLKQDILRFVTLYNSPAAYIGNRAHEWKHYDTQHSIRNYLGAEKLPMTLMFRPDICPEELINFYQHNEIISRIATVLAQREIFQATRNLNVFADFAQPYKEAIKQRYFCPNHMTPWQSELENRFIALMCAQWWIKKEQPLNIFVNRQKLTTWFQRGSKKRIKPNPVLYAKMLDFGYTFIKDGRLVNLNYFFNPYSLEKRTQPITLNDLLRQAEESKSFYLPHDFFKNPPLFGDLQPQPEVLAILPKLRKKEARRLIYENKKAYQTKKKVKTIAMRQRILD